MKKYPFIESSHPRSQRAGRLHQRHLPPISSLICAKPSLEISTQRSFFSETRRLWLKDADRAACAPFQLLLALRFHEGFLYNLSLDKWQRDNVPNDIFYSSLKLCLGLTRGKVTQGVRHRNDMQSVVPSDSEIQTTSLIPCALH